MKRFVLLFIISIGMSVYAQTDSLAVDFPADSVPDIEEITLDMLEMAPMEILEEDHNSKDYIRYMCFFTGVDFGLVSVQNESIPLKQSQSFSLRLNLMEYKKQLVENRFGVFSGVSLSYQQFGFQDNFKFINTGIETHIYTDTLDYLKNQLRSFSVSVPIMFEVNSKNTFEKNMHFSFGLQGNYRYANSTYQKYRISSATIKRKNSEEIYINKLNFEACVRVGYQNITFFASRSLTPLFSPNKFPTELYPVVVGLCIIPANTKPDNFDDFDF
jgi:hypothetical protein